MTSESSQILSNTEKRLNSIQKFKDDGFEAGGDAICERCKLKNIPCMRLKTGSKKCLSCVNCSVVCKKSDTAAPHNPEGQSNLERPHNEGRKLMEGLDKVQTKIDTVEAELADIPPQNAQPTLEETPENGTAMWNLPLPSTPASLPVEAKENPDFQNLFYGGDWDPSLFRPPF
jgi:hypothetical protein